MEEDWKVPFGKFEEAYQQVERAFQMPSVAEENREYVAEQVKEMIEKGWLSLALYLDENKQEKPAGNLLENVHQRVNQQVELRAKLNQKKQIEVDCDAEKLMKQQWEIREVIFPAFRDLRNYLEEKI